jgi:hypothetical protein
MDLEHFVLNHDKVIPHRKSSVDGGGEVISCGKNYENLITVWDKMLGM